MAQSVLPWCRCCQKKEFFDLWTVVWERNIILSIEVRLSGNSSFYLVCANHGPQIKNSVFGQQRHHGMPCLGHFINRYEPFIDRNLTYRHRGNCCINCMLVFHSFAMILLVEHTCNFSRDFNKNYFLQARPSESAVSA